jgi:hypothetical protein
MGASISVIDQSVLMSQSSKIYQIEVNSTAPNVSRPTPELQIRQLIVVQRILASLTQPERGVTSLVATSAD